MSLSNQYLRLLGDGDSPVIHGSFRRECTDVILHHTTHATRQCAQESGMYSHIVLKNMERLSYYCYFLKCPRFRRLCKCHVY